MRNRLLFIGDSLVEFFDWAARFPEHTVHNLGQAGETVDGLHRRLGRIIGNLDAVDSIFIMSGINNLAMEDKGFIAAYRRIIRDLTAHYPSSRVFVHSLLPVVYPFISNEDVLEMNVKLKALAGDEGVFYMDIHSRFLDGDGRPDPDLLDEDGIHLSERGYSVWAGEIEKLIRLV